MATLVYSLNANNSASYPGSGSSWYDVSGISYPVSVTASLINSPTFVNAGDYKYLQFTNAAGQYAQFAGATSAGVEPGSSNLAGKIYQQSFSIAMWVRLDTTPYVGDGGSANAQALTSMAWYGGFGQHIQFYFACGGAGTTSMQNQWGCAWFNSPSTTYLTSTTGLLGGAGYTISTGVFHHVVGVWDSAGTIKMYVDGVQVASLNTIAGATVPLFTGYFYNQIYINRSWATAPGSSDTPYIGNASFNSYQIYQGALTAGEVLTLYSGGYTNPAPANQRGVPLELGLPVTTRQFSWNEMVRRAWGSEFSAPDHRVYEFSNGRGFDSTDRGDTGFYEPPST